MLFRKSKKMKPFLVGFYSFMTKISKKFVAYTYRKLFYAEWFIGDCPENFDHEIDLYYQWDMLCAPHWLERGIYSIQALKMFENPVVIELCCGDGFNAKYFYSSSAQEIHACDFDASIIKTAIKKNSKDNIEFKVADIREGIANIFNGTLDKDVTNIIWDAAIEHFTKEEIHSLMSDIKKTLSTTNGILSGFTVVEEEGHSFVFHEIIFKDIHDLKRYFEPYFKNVYAFETIYKDRHNLYFYASDGDIPFAANWKHGIN